jgi:V/A-type H+-transporting ATPase subunit I
MIKYDFIVYHADVPAFLEELQQLGVADTHRSPKPVDEHSSTLMEQAIRYTAACKKLNKISPETPEPATREYTAEHILKRTEELFAEREQLTERKFKLAQEIELARPWLTWDCSAMDRLKELGLTPHFYTVPEKSYNEAWEKEHIVKVINRNKGKVYFTVLEQEGEPFTFRAQEVKFPSAPAEILENEQASIATRMDIIQQKLEKYALLKDRLEERLANITEDLEVYLTGKSARPQAADTLMIITAFIPEDNNEAVVQFLDRQQVVYVSEAATIDDDPPVALKNNRFSRLFEPVGAMFMPPKYDELDVTKFFSPFYMLFFGFCLGDIGYGLIILLIATLGKFMLPPKMKPMLSLGQLLGIGAIIMPVLSGTFFGLKIGELFPATAHLFLDDLQMFYFALAFGGFQVIFAKLVQAFDRMKRYGFAHGLSALGWALLMISAALMILRSGVGLPIPQISILLTAGISAVCILFFSSLKKNIFKRLWGGITSIYDITGLFGDLLSYIRLFGLATAGGILGFVINTIGSLLWGLPYVGWLVGGLVFLIGHIAVMALSALSAAVHPMRLTFVEFYKNIGFTGGGRIYKPLRKENLK